MGNQIVLVTGGLGFIGTHLIANLAKRGYTVRVLDPLTPQVHGDFPAITAVAFQGLGLQFVRADIRDSRALADAMTGVEAIVHLAAETGTAQSMYEIARYNSVNSQGTAEILDWMSNNKHCIKRFVLASSRSIYGEGAYSCPTCGVAYPKPRTATDLIASRWEPHCPKCGLELTAIATSEEAPPQPASIYAATKLAQEDLVRIACDALGVPFGILRFQNVYGAGQSLNNPYTGILSIFSTRIRRGLDLPIFEDGLESRDFVHVSDIVSAIGLVLTSTDAEGQTFNVGSGQPTSVMTVARMLNEALGGHSECHVTGQYRIGDIRHCYADISRLAHLTGFSPAMPLAEGLERFAQWTLAQPLPEDRLDSANTLLIERGLMK